MTKRSQNFWKLESYGTLPKTSPELLPPNEKRSLEINDHQETTIIKDNSIETGLLWKKEELVLLHNRTLALNQYQSNVLEVETCRKMTNYMTYHSIKYQQT